MDICKQCKKNFELEKEVRFFDQRIALLINHKITIEVWYSTTKVAVIFAELAVVQGLA